MKKKFESKIVCSNKFEIVINCKFFVCNWRVRGVKTRGSEMWMVSKYVNDYIQHLDTLRKSNKLATSKIVISILKQKYSDPRCVYIPSNIQNDMQLVFRVDIS